MKLKVCLLLLIVIIYGCDNSLEADNKKNEDKIIVAESIKINAPSDKLYINDNEITLSVTVNPENSIYSNILWSSSDDKIIKIDSNGKIKALKEGKSIITAKLGELQDTLEIQTYPVLATSIKINEITEKLFINGNEVSLSVSIIPLNTTNKILKWKSSNDNIIEIDDSGNIKALADGSSVITVEMGELSDNVTIKTSPIVPASVEINEIDNRVYIGGSSKQLTATIFPDNSTDKSIKWTSSNENIALIDADGKITAVNEGKVEITAETINGKLNKFEISSKFPEIIKNTSGNGYYLISPNKDKYNVGEMITVTAYDREPGWALKTFQCNDIDIPISRDVNSPNSEYTFEILEDTNIVIEVDRISNGMPNYYYGSLISTDVSFYVSGSIGYSGSFWTNISKHNILIENNRLYFYLKNENNFDIDITNVTIYSIYTDGLTVYKSSTNRADLLSDYILSNGEIIHLNMTLEEELNYAEVHTWKVVWQLMYKGVPFELITYWTGPEIL